ncbi:hypothetical protein GF312_22170 [Candidatus Poribacteria bacterium]|nr:hypothetical protein [Candidatus Poribacteria bacterium]
MEEALLKSDVEYAEIRIEDESKSWANFRGVALDSVGSSKTVGGMVRALYKGAWGYADFNDLKNLKVRVKEACESAKLIGKDKSKLARVEPVQHMTRFLLEKDFRNIPLSEKISVIQEYNDILLNYHEKIETTNVMYRDSFRKIWYANTEGTYIEDERPYATAYISATAKDGDNIQPGRESIGSSAGFQVVEGLHEKAEKAAKRAVDLLAAPPVKGGKYTVVTNPRLTGVFAHEAFGHLSESDFVYENERMKEIMVLGRRFGPNNLNIIDDGSFPDQQGTLKYDDEGVKTRQNYLIKDGILVGRLHSRETAATMGESVTGNARALAYHNEPIVRMTNTYINKGQSAFDDMIKDVKLGIYALDMIGGQTTMEMFTFSAGYAYMIRDGQICELIRDVVLTGNVFNTLMNIDMIGDDLQWAPGGPGGCGKGGQSGLTVGIGGPHIRIQDVVVGGRQ